MDALVNDERFGKMFTDNDFLRDKNSAAYRLIKPTDAKRRKDDDVDSIEGDEEENPRGNEVNKIFGGKGDLDSDDEGANNKDFEQRLNKNQRKHMKKQNNDKILIGKGLFNSQARFADKKNDKSKHIKKGKFGNKNIITD